MTVWPVKTLGEVCEVARGTSITRKETKEGMIPVVAGGIDVAYFHSVQNRPAGTITVSSSGANAGFVNRWDVPIFASDCSTVVAKEGGMVFGDYAFRFLQFKQNFINAELRRGAAQPHVYAKDIATIEIPVPPMEEQKRIVELLDAATERVTELTMCYEQARTHANNLFESACRTEFDNQHSRSPIVTLPDVCKNLDGRRKPITKSDREAGDIPYYGASGIVDYVKGYIFDERTLLISEDGANLLARSTPIAFTADGKYWVNNHAHVVKFENTVTETYVEIFLNSIPIDNWVTGAAQPKLTQAALNRIPIPMPPLEEQKQIVVRLDSMRAKTSEMVAAYDAKLTAAKDLRQSILESAFAGEL